MSAERDPTALFIFLGCVVVAVIAVVVAWRRGKRPTLAASDEEAVKAAEVEKRRVKAALDKSVEAGTHLADGQPRCQASPLCSSRAVVPAPVIVRSAHASDFVRRLFGAPQRYRVEVPPLSEGEAFYCDPHSHLAEQETRAELAEVEHGRQLALRDVEARLAHFERAGLAARMARLIEAESRKAGR